LDRAEEQARILLENAANYGVPKYVAIAQRLLGEIATKAGDHNRAEDVLILSIEPFANHPMPLIEWRNHVAMGRLMAARNRPAAARESFGKAEKLVREMAAGIVDPELRSVYLRSTAVKSTH
jgi:hypothetical protein